MSLVPICSFPSFFSPYSLNHTGQIHIVQTYQNQKSKPIEAVFIWPKDEKAAVTELIINVDGKKVRGDVMAKEDAQNKYDDAIAAGNSAYLLQQTRPDVLELSVGTTICCFS